MTLTITATSSTAANITLDNPTLDGYINDLTTHDETDSKIWMGGQSAPRIYRSYIEWNISIIPSSATINVMKFLYHGYIRYGSADSQIRSIVYQPSVTGYGTIYTDCGDGNVYASDTGFPIVGTNQTITLGATSSSTACIDLMAHLSAGSSWFAIGLQGKTESGENSASIYSEDYGAANPKPSLYIEYEYVSSVTFSNCILENKIYTRKIEKHLFRDGTYASHDTGKNNLQLTIAGVENSSATSKFSTVYSMMDLGYYVTLSGFSDTTINTDWYIKDFEYDARLGSPDVYDWRMTLTSVT